MHFEILEEYLEKLFLGPADVMSVVIAFAIGSFIFVAGMKFGLFHLHAPKWFGVDYWYREAAHGLLGFCAFLATWYDMGRGATSRALRWSRSNYRLQGARIERARRKLLMTLATGAPGPRDQHFVQSAYVSLERERQATVRAAVSEAIRHVRDWPDYESSERRATLDAVRDIAGYMAGRVFKERMGVVSDLVRYGLAEEIRHGFDDVVRGLAMSRQSVARTALALAGRRIEGESVLRDTSAAVNHLLSDERFDVRLAALVPGRSAATVLVLETGHAVAHAVPAGASLRSYRAEGLTRLEKSARWLSDIVRLSVDAVTQERASWFVSDRFGSESVVGTRRAIQRYARDMSFNVAMIVIVMLVFLTALALRT